MIESDRIYFAAILDGEGCIGLYRNKGSRDERYRSGFKSPSWIRSVSVSSTCHSLLDDLMQASELGVIRPLSKPAGCKQQYQWSIGSKQDIITFLSMVLPFLREKKGQAEAMLAECLGEFDTVRAAKFLKEAKH